MYLSWVEFVTMMDQVELWIECLVEYIVVGHPVYLSWVEFVTMMDPILPLHPSVSYFVHEYDVLP